MGVGGRGEGGEGGGERKADKSSWYIFCGKFWYIFLRKTSPNNSNVILNFIKHVKT